jgi:exosortase B
MDSQRLLRPGHVLPLVLPVLAILGLLVPSYHEVALRLWPQEGLSYAPLLALLALGLLLYRGRWLSFVPDKGFPVLGSVLLFIGVISYVLGRSQKLELIELAATMPLLAGGLTILGGRQVLREMRFPLLFLVFSLPFPAWVIDSLTQPLKIWISQGAESLLYAAGYPIARSGVLLSLGQYRLLVADACSGLHSLIFLSAMGLLYVHFTGHRSSWHRWVLYGALVPIAIFANFVRVVILLLITYHMGNAIGQSYWHDMAGIVLFVSAFAALFGLDSLLGRMDRPGRPIAQACSPPAVSLPALGWGRALWLTLALLLAAIAAQYLTPTRYQADQRKLDLETLVPGTFADWRIDDQARITLVSPEIKANLERLYSQSLARTYINSHGQRIMLSIAYGGNQLGNELQAHRPEYCYRAQGFTLLDAHESRLILPGQDLSVRRLVARQEARTEPVTYWMTVGDHLALPGLSRKIAQIRYGLQGQIPDGMLVRISSVDRDSERAFALQADFITDLQQHIPGQLGFAQAATHFVTE